MATSFGFLNNGICYHIVKLRLKLKLTKGLKENAFGLAEAQEEEVVSTYFVPYDLKTFWGKKRQNFHIGDHERKFFFGFIGLVKLGFLLRYYQNNSAICIDIIRITYQFEPTLSKKEC